MRWTIICLFLIANICATAQAPKRELRGAFIATVNNIDWPTVGATMATQQAQLRAILDAHKASGMNAIFLQIRTQCDALYNSTIEPWSNIVGGTQGTSPGYDPLAFALAECRKRGIELHAWINPYRAVVNFNQIATYAPNHIAVTRPDLLLSQGTLRILDPGKPEVWDYVIKVTMDIVRRYDVDGIHFDDYFYPYPPSSGAAFDDNATFTAFPRGFTNIGDWRRANVDTLIKRVNDSIQGAKPWVKFGVSPFGIWRNQSSDATGSATNGLQSYSDIYANSKKWIQNNWVDYLAPQIYWSIGLAVANYSVLIPWWNTNANARHIYSAMAAYKVGNGGTDANFNLPAQIPNQIRLNRQQTNVRGGIFYNTTSVNANPLGMRDSLRNDLWARAALLPNMPWIDNNPPAAPSGLTATAVGTNSVKLQWQAPATQTNEFDKAKQYVVYRFANANVDITNATAIRTVTPVDTVEFTDTNVPNGMYTYVVTSLDRMHNESISNTQTTISLGTTNINAIIPALTYVKILSQHKSFTVEYSLKEKAAVQYSIVNLEGQIMDKKIIGNQFAGPHQLTNLLFNQPIGAYYLQLQINNVVKTIRIVKVH